MEDFTRRSLAGGLIGSLVAGGAIASVPENKEHKIPAIDKLCYHGPFAGASLSEKIIWTSCVSDYKANDIVYHTRYKIIPLRHILIMKLDGVDKTECTGHSVTVTGSYFANRDEIHSKISEILFMSDSEILDEYNRIYGEFGIHWTAATKNDKRVKKS